MATVGYATLDVIPSVRGLSKELNAQTAGLAAAGKKGGAQYGAAAGTQAASGFRSKLATGLKGFAPFAGILAGAGVAALFTDAIGEAKEAAKVSRVTAQLVESTGKAANLSAAQVGALSEKMMEYAAVDDELVQSGANVMLTFRNVKNAAGEGNNIFDRSIKAGLDLAAVLGTDLSSSAVQLGKALNDPIKGVTALGRAGVQFTQQQKDQIKAMVESGDLLGAQRLVLSELEGQVGGAAGAAADGTDRLAVAMGNLKESVGAQVLPAVEGFSNWAVDDGIPALVATGGAVKDAAQFFNDLPGPVKAATGALVAFRLAQATGVTTGLASGLASISSSFDSLRVRGMLAADSYRSARKATLDLTATSARFSPQAGRMSASLQAIKAGAAGAGGALRSGLGGAMSLLGGPWGVALAAGTAAVTYFWQENRAAKQYVEDLTGSLDKQTGAITDNTRELVFNKLQQSGAIDAAKTLGISLDDVRLAAEGNEAAIARVRGVTDELSTAQTNFSIDAVVAAKSWIGVVSDQEEAAAVLSRAIGSTRGALDDAKDGTRDYNAFAGESVTQNSASAGGFRDLATQMRGAKDEVRGLLNAENARRDALLKNRRDQLALRQALADTRAEMREGKRTLDLNTQAGRDNQAALLDLADQWNNSSSKVRNAKGAYSEMRQAFIDTAKGMGASGKQARQLAEELLKLPKRKATTIDLPGMDKALADAARLRNLLQLDRRNQNVRRLGGLNLAGARADGGPVTGGKTYLVGERGPELFTARQSGHITPNHQMPAVNVQGGTPIHIGQVVAQDVNGMLRDLQRRQALSAYDGIPR